MLQQQMTTLGATFINKEHEIKGAIYSTKWATEDWKTLPDVLIYAATFR